MIIYIVVWVLPACVSSQMGMCPITSTIDVSLSSNFEQDEENTFACPGDLVTFICEVNQSISIQIAAEPFICRADPVFYIASDQVGNPGRTGPNDAFRANLANVQREAGLTANYTVTLATHVTNLTNGTTVECSDQLTSSSVVRRKTLIQSDLPNPPSRLIYTLDNRECISGLVDSNASNYTCEVLLFWFEPRGMFDLDFYVLSISRDNMASSNITINTTNTSFEFNISPNASFSVSVMTVSKCGDVSNAAVLQEENFLNIDEFLRIRDGTVEMTGAAASVSTLSNMVVIGFGCGLLSLATLVSLLRLRLIDLQQPLFKCLIGLERLLTCISLLMIVIMVFLLLQNINESCDGFCLATMSLFLIFALSSTVVTCVITICKCYRYYSDGWPLQHPKFVIIQNGTEEDGGDTKQSESENGFTGDEDVQELLSLEVTANFTRLVVRKCVAKEQIQTAV